MLLEQTSWLDLVIELLLAFNLLVLSLFMKTACIAFPIGCPRNRLNAAHLVNYFRKNGWHITTNFKKADFVLISSCGYTQYKEDMSIKFLEIANRRKKKGAKLFTFGCLGGINKERLLENFNITILENSSLAKIDSLIDSNIKMSEIDVSYDLSKYEDLIGKCYSILDRIALQDQKYNHIKGELKSQFKRLASRCLDGSKVKSSPSKPFKNGLHENKGATLSQEIMDIRISYGCNGLCTYCAIKFSAGPLTSIHPGKILKQVGKGLMRGYRTFTLVADDAGAYGTDRRTDITQLLKSILNLHDDIRIRFNDFSPKWLIRYFRDIQDLYSNYPENFQSICLPIQSGSEKILKLMKREYTAKDAREHIAALKENVPELSINSHVLVGFPSETDEDFLSTLNFLEDLQFDKVFVYPYSERPGIPSSEIKPKVHRKVIKERIDRIRCLKIGTNFKFSELSPN